MKAMTTILGTAALIGAVGLSLPLLHGLPIATPAAPPTSTAPERAAALRTWHSVYGAVFGTTTEENAYREARKAYFRPVLERTLAVRPRTDAARAAFIQQHLSPAERDEVALLMADEMLSEAIAKEISAALRNQRQ
jgi:hypothetical protein